MNHNQSHIIDPNLITDASSFEWIAKKLAAGFMHGKHESARLGTGMEFQQYRPYVSGDDIRGIDWKMYAKTDKFYIKQTSIQTEHQFVFILDNSKSMKYTEETWSKFIFAKMLVTTITRVLANQGDQFSWQASNNLFPMGSGLRHWQFSLETLYNLETAEKNEFIPLISQQPRTLVWISDFYQSISAIEDKIKQLKTPKSELILFHLLGSAEKELNFNANATFVDLENDERLDVNAPQTRAAYIEKLNAHLSAVRNVSLKNGVHYEEVLFNQAISDALQRFFHHYQYTAV